ncbi:MAG: hypothetical protein DWI57_10110 [Chloroflexi bacterium]|nr:MAG: hypothetical protein DWI57_10110 [Chloroflexota bacterium]
MLNNNSSLARWCGIAGIVGIALGVVTGVLGLMNPASVYAPPPGLWNYTATLGKIVLFLEGVAILGFTASFIGFHLIGAVGNGALGKTATVLSVIGNLGAALGFMHSAFIGELSPITNVGYLLLPGLILMTVAALRTKRVSTLKAWMPLGILIGLMIIELGLPMSGITDMIHQAVYGALSFVVLSEVGKA